MIDYKTSHRDICNLKIRLKQVVVYLLVLTPGECQELEQHSQAVTPDWCLATNKILITPAEYKYHGEHAGIKADHLNTIVRAVKTSPVLSPAIFHNSEPRLRV